MLKSVMLILDNRLELGTKYKKTGEKLFEKVFLADNKKDAFEIILKYEPDLILVSDSFEGNFKELVKNIKFSTHNHRPTIIFISKSAQVEDKLFALNNGADDYLSEPIGTDELKARIYAHLRRIVETHINTSTGLIEYKFTCVVLKRAINTEKSWASLLVMIDNYIQYKEVYGALAAEKMVQTFVAIINSALAEDDFLGQLSENEFLVITKPDKAEKVAAYLVFGFDTVKEKFYNDEDFKNKYILINNDNTPEEKTGLALTKIAIVSNQLKKYTELKQVLNDLLLTLKLTKNKSFSSYAVDRIKFPTNDIISNIDFNNKVAIIETDDALSYLLATTARMQDYMPIELSWKDDIISELKKEKPSVLILDMGEIETKFGLELCKKIREVGVLSKMKIILTSNLHNKDEIMNAGADIYLPKPYDLITVYSWVQKLVKDFNF